MENSDYEFATELVNVPQRSPEWWARAVFEGAPALLRSALPVAWRGFLGARLGPRSSQDHVLGMPIVRSEPGVLVLGMPSRLLEANNAVHVDGERVRWETSVRYLTRAARVIWPVAAIIHQRVVPYLLARARHRA